MVAPFGEQIASGDGATRSDAACRAASFRAAARKVWACAGPLRDRGDRVSRYAAVFSSVFLCSLLTITAAQATEYPVGPGHAYETPSDVPWESLLPGDTVLIHWRDAPYADKWVLGRSGTPSQPITVRGVPGPGGQLPVIDGNGARTRRQLDYSGETRAVIKIGYSNVPADSMPSYIIIENLDIRGARTWHTFSDDGGSPAQYDENAAAVWIEKGEHIVLRRNWLHDSGNGLFVSSGDHTSRAILVEGNEIFDNGYPGSFHEHNVYTEALDITFQFNHLGRLRAGSEGNNLKDRSGGLVVRYNWIEGGNRQLDLVDSHTPDITGSPSYGETFVYGNVLVEEDGDFNRQIVMYGGDSGDYGTYRKGVLNFYNNTVVSYRGDRTTLFFVPTNDESLDIRNNLFYAAAGGETLSIADTSGRLDLANNWFQPGFQTTFSTLEGLVNGILESIVSAAPGFVDGAARDFGLGAGSSARDAGGSVPAAARHPVLFQYVPHGGSAPRPSDGIIDIGAFESGTTSPAVPVPPPTVDPQPPPPETVPEPTPEPTPEPAPDPAPEATPDPVPVSVPLTIATTSVPSGTAGQTYEAVFQAEGGTGQYLLDHHSLRSAARPDA